jgi:hypothetical protein
MGIRVERCAIDSDPAGGECMCQPGPPPSRVALRMRALVLLGSTGGRRWPELMKHFSEQLVDVLRWGRHCRWPFGVWTF